MLVSKVNQPGGNTYRRHKHKKKRKGSLLKAPMIFHQRKLVVQDAVQINTAIGAGTITSAALTMPTSKTVFANPMSVTAPVQPLHAGGMPIHALMFMILW